MRPFTESDRAWLHGHCEMVRGHYRERLSPHREKFRLADHLADRFRDACEAVLQNGWSQWPAVETSHNELCVAVAILESPGYEVTCLQYEPQTEGCDRTIDFVAEGGDGQVWLVDVKTITPEHIDRWGQFEKATEENWLTPSTRLVIFREWLGGEIWHSQTAARSRMLAYTLEFEDKLADCYPGFDPLRSVLMLCGNGFHWHEDELEDFVSFYAAGTHRPDDPLGAMEQHYIEETKIKLPRRVERFGYLQRETLALVPSRVNWHVQPPRFPASMVP